MLTMFQILFKGLRARVELSETEVRLAKQSVRCDSTDEGEATLGCSQSLPKHTVQELCERIHLLERPCMPSSCPGLGSAHTVRPTPCNWMYWNLVADLLTGFLSGQLGC